MARIIFIIAQEGFQDYEYEVPFKALKENNHNCTTASVTIMHCQGKYGKKVIPDIAIRDLITDSYDAMVLIGGPGTLSLVKDPFLLSFIREMNSNNKLIAAICMAPTILAITGILKNKKATVWKSDISLEAFKNNNVEYTKEDIVIEDNIITANGVEAAEKFAKEILHYLKSKNT